MPELIENGITGFIVDDLDHAIEAIGHIGQINRAMCREIAKKRFSIDHMADAYIALYQQICA